jgi:hypothetical protein
LAVQYDGGIEGIKKARLKRRAIFMLASVRAAIPAPWLPAQCIVLRANFFNALAARGCSDLHQHNAETEQNKGEQKREKLIIHV